MLVRTGYPDLRLSMRLLPDRRYRQFHGRGKRTLRFYDFSQLIQRGSGIGTTPVFGSMVQNGKLPLQYRLWSAR